ncbi:VOC family protein [Nonomuraea salmonea]|uniref:VOC family protein n=1 Tax=Nonomuraea salmonea TaxID=46181 RepID=UPI0031F18C14
MVLAATVLGAPDARALAAFYQRLLGWDVREEESDWVVLRAPDERAGLSFQTEAAHVRPTWPAGPGDQQMMMHLDIEVDDLETAGAHAVEAGGDACGLPAPGRCAGLSRSRGASVLLVHAVERAQPITSRTGVLGSRVGGICRGAMAYWRLKALAKANSEP